MNKKTILFIVYIFFTSTILAPAANDIFLPALTIIAAKLNTTHVQLMVTSFMIALALGQLIYGPLLDRFGRKKVLLTALAIFIIGSVVVSFSSDFSVVILGRILEGIGISACIPGALCIAKDIVPQENLPEAMGFIFGSLALVQCVSPFIGGLMTTWMGWHGSFYLLTLLGLLYFVFLMLLVPETQQSPQKSMQLKQLFQTYKSLAKIKGFSTYLLLGATAYGALFSYLVAAPVFYHKDLGLTVIIVGLILAVNAVSLATTGFSSGYLVKRFGLNKFIGTGIGFNLIGSIVFILLSWLTGPSIFGIAIPMFFIFIGIGTIRPGASTACVNLSPKESIGSASSLYSFSCFTGGAIISILAHYLALTSLLSFAWLMLILSVITAATWLMGATANPLPKTSSH